MLLDLYAGACPGCCPGSAALRPVRLGILLPWLADSDPPLLVLLLLLARLWDCCLSHSRACPALPLGTSSDVLVVSCPVLAIGSSSHCSESLALGRLVGCPPATGTC